MAAVENVKTIRTLQGEEIISAEVTSITEDGVAKYRLKAPMLLGMGPNGQPSVIPYIFTSGIPKDMFIGIPTMFTTYVGPTDEDIAMDYLKMVKLADSIITPGSQKIFTGFGGNNLQ